MSDDPIMAAAVDALMGTGTPEFYSGCYRVADEEAARSLAGMVLAAVTPWFDSERADAVTAVREQVAREIENEDEWPCELGYGAFMGATRAYAHAARIARGAR